MWCYVIALNGGGLQCPKWKCTQILWYVGERAWLCCDGWLWSDAFADLWPNKPWQYRPNTMKNKAPCCLGCVSAGELQLLMLSPCHNWTATELVMICLNLNGEMTAESGRKLPKVPACSSWHSTAVALQRWRNILWPRCCSTVWNSSWYSVIFCWLSLEMSVSCFCAFSTCKWNEICSGKISSSQPPCLDLW